MAVCFEGGACGAIFLFGGGQAPRGAPPTNHHTSELSAAPPSIILPLSTRPDRFLLILGPPNQNLNPRAPPSFGVVCIVACLPCPLFFRPPASTTPSAPMSNNLSDRAQGALSGKILAGHSTPLRQPSPAVQHPTGAAARATARPYITNTTRNAPPAIFVT